MAGARQHETLARAVWTVLLHTVAALGLLFLLWELRTIVSWVMVSILFALALDPLVRRLRKRGVRRGLAVLLVSLAVLAVIVTFFSLLMPMVVEQVKALIEGAPQLLERLSEWSVVRWAEERLGLVDRVQALIAGSAGEVAQPALRFAAGVVQAVVGLVTILVLAVFNLLFGGEVFRLAIAWISPERRAHVAELAQKMRHAVGGYVAGVLIVAAIGGTVMAVALAILGVPYFLALGMIMIFLGIIPYIGSTIAAVLIIGLTLAATGLRNAIIMAVIYVVYQQIENNLLQPLVQRRTLRMNALIIVLALLAGAALAGILGALLALPIAAALQVLLQDLLAHRQERWTDSLTPPGSVTPPGPA